ncbi:MAG: DUF2892 domain-containing protein [Bacteroidota bacterium]|nr:DUF2892 domain-containing protein [Bacteroidota bacterium]
MKKNMGTVDRVIRILIAAAILILKLTNIISGTFAVVLLVLAGILVLTSLVGICPLYHPLGLSTKKN